MSPERGGDASKSKNPLFVGSVSKKGQAELALFWNKGDETHYCPSIRGALRAPVGCYAAEDLRAPDSSRIEIFITNDASAC
jgi:hypothetical protein